MNIVLIGYRCCGKTSAGKYIAEKLNRTFLDTDELIREKVSVGIDDIVSRHGWDHFRELERDVIQEVSSHDNLVVATGGGVVTDRRNIENLKKNGVIIWLYTDLKTIKKRMQEDTGTGENRPSLTGMDSLDEIECVMKEREPLYESAADVSIDTGSMRVDEVGELVLIKAGKLKAQS